MTVAPASAPSLEEWLAALIADDCAVDRHDLAEQALETITGSPHRRSDNESVPHG